MTSTPLLVITSIIGVLKRDSPPSPHHHSNYITLRNLGQWSSTSSLIFKKGEKSQSNCNRVRKLQWSSFSLKLEKCEKGPKLHNCVTVGSMLLLIEIIIVITSMWEMAIAYSLKLYKCRKGPLHTSQIIEVWEGIIGHLLLITPIIGVWQTNNVTSPFHHSSYTTMKNMGQWSLCSPLIFKKG